MHKAQTVARTEPGRARFLHVTSPAAASVVRSVMPWSNPAAGEERRLGRFCLAAAFAVTLAWGCIYIGQNHAGVVDEPGQLEAIRHFAAKQPGIPESLPNLPGYHFLVILFSGGNPTLRSARLVTLGCALLGLAAFAGAWRQRHGRHPGGATLLLALLPVMQPFTAMAYTDVPAMTLLFAACWAHFGGRRVWSAGLLALACLVRQTCLIWAAYLLALDALECIWPRTPGAAVPRMPWRPALAAWLERGRWLLLLLATGAGIILYAGRLTLGTAHGNQLQPNPATIHFAGFLLLLLGLPTWVMHAGPHFHAWREALRLRPGRTIGGTVLAFGVAAVLAATYANPHVWNRELFWLEPPSTFVLLRNWPLVWIERIAALRVISGLVVVGVTAGLVHRLRRERCARELLLLLPFGAALLLTNGLVEPRYFIPPCALALLFLAPGPSGMFRQFRWFALLCLVQSAFLLEGLALW